MKKIISYILILILFLGAIAGPFSFKYNQKIIRSAVKKTIRAGVDESATEKFTVSKQEIENNFHFIHSMEFRYKNKLYDIISKNENADSTTFVVINDEKEELLLENFKKFKPENHKLSNVFNINLINSLVFLTIFPEYLNNFTYFDIFYIIELNNKKLLNLILLIDTPPPRYSTF